MIATILGFIGGKASAAGILAGLGILFVILKKVLPKYAGNAAAKGISEGFKNIDKIGDPVEKELVHNIAVAVVKWAEYKIPDKGQGRVRFDMAAAKLCALLPFLKGRDKDLADIIENAVVAMDNELKKAVGKPE